MYAGDNVAQPLSHDPTVAISVSIPLVIIGIVSLTVIIVVPIAIIMYKRSMYCGRSSSFIIVKERVMGITPETGQSCPPAPDEPRDRPISSYCDPHDLSEHLNSKVVAAV